MMKRKKKNKWILKIFILLFSIGIVGSLAQIIVYFFNGGITERIFSVVGLLIVILFSLMNFYLVEIYIEKRDIIFLLLLISLFIWPLVRGSISFYYLGSIFPPKKIYEVVFGGIGDFTTVICLVDTIGLNTQLEIDVTPQKLSLLFLLCTNTLLFFPIKIYHDRVKNHKIK